MNLIQKTSAFLLAFIVGVAPAMAAVHEGFTREALVNTVTIEDTETGHRAGDSATVELKVPDNNILFKRNVDNPTPEISEIITIEIIVSNRSDILGIPDVEIIDDFDETHFEYVDGSLNSKPVDEGAVMTPFSCRADAAEITCEADEFPPMTGEIMISYQLKPLKKGESTISLTVTDAHEHETTDDLHIIVDDPKNYYTLTRNADKNTIEVGEEVNITTHFTNRHPNKRLEDIWYFDDYPEDFLELKKIQATGIGKNGEKVTSNCQKDGIEIRCHLEEMFPWESRTVVATYTAIAPGTAIGTARVYDEDDSSQEHGDDSSSFRIAGLLGDLFQTTAEEDEAGFGSDAEGGETTGNANEEETSEGDTNNPDTGGEETKTENGENPSLAEQDITVTIREPGNPLLVTKDANKTSVAPGEEFQIVTSLTNRTAHTIEDFRLTDTMTTDIAQIIDVSSPTGIRCEKDSVSVFCHVEELQGGKSHSFIVKYKALKTGTFTSTTSVVQEESFEGEPLTEDKIANVFVENPGNPFILRKTPNKRTTYVGEEILYTITLKNRSDHETLENIRIFDDFDEELLEYKELTINPNGEGLNCSADASNIVCDLERLAPDDVYTIVTRYETIAPGRALNTVSVTDEKGLNLTVEDGGGAGEEDPTTFPFTDESGFHQEVTDAAPPMGVSFTADSDRIAVADADVIIKESNNPFFLTKRVERTEVREGESVKFLITVENRDKRITLTDVVLRDTYPTDLLRVNTSSIPANCSVSAGYILCDIGTLAPEEKFQFIPEFTALTPTVITEEEETGTEEGKTYMATNTAEVSTVDFDEEAGGYSDISTADVIIKESNNPFYLTKNASKLNLEPGEQVQFTIILQNNFKEEKNFSDVVLTDTYPVDLLQLDETSVPDCVVSAGTITCNVGTLSHRGYGVIPDNNSYFKISPVFKAKRRVDDVGSITATNTVEANDGVGGHADMASSDIIIKDPGNPILLQKNPNNGVVEVGEEVQYIAFLRNRDPNRTLERIEILDDFDEEFLELVNLTTVITNDDQEIVSGGHTCKADVSKIFCDVDKLEANQTLSIIADYKTLKAGRPLNTITATDKDGNTDEQIAEIIIPDPGSPFVISKYPHDGNTPPKPKTTVEVGEDVFFTVNIQNIHEAKSLYNVTVTDEFPSDILQFKDIFSSADIQCSPDAMNIVCNIPEIKPGQNISFTSVYTAINPGTATNTATATTENECELCEAENEGCCTIAAESNIIVPTADNPFLITKTPNNGIVEVGEEVEFTVMVENRTEGRTLKNINLLDNFDEEFLELQTLETRPISNSCTGDAISIKCNLRELEAGETFMIISTFKAIQEGSTTNTVEVKDNSGQPVEEQNIAGEESTIKIKQSNNPLFLSKSVSRTDIDAGDKVEFTITVQNRHDFEKFENIVLEEEYPADSLRLDTATIPENCSASAGMITCDIRNLYTVAQNQADKNLLNKFVIKPVFTGLRPPEASGEDSYFEPITAKNTARVSDGGDARQNEAESKVVIHDPNDPTGGASGSTNPSGEDNGSVIANGELLMRKTVNKSTVEVGEKLTYTLTISNLGEDQTFDNVVMVDEYPNDLLEVVSESLPEECGADATQVTCAIGDLDTENKTSHTVEIEFIALENGEEVQEAVNTAMATDGQGVYSSNKASVTVVVKAAENPFSLMKKTNKTLVEVGEKVQFEITLRNKDENRVFENITLNDDFPEEDLQLLPESLPEVCSISAEEITCDVGDLSPKETNGCTNVPVAARSPDTGECFNYNTSCDVPEGWNQMVNETCENTDAPYLFRNTFVIRPEFIALETGLETEEDGVLLDTKMIENKSEARDNEGHTDLSSVTLFLKNPDSPFELTKGIAGGNTSFEVGEEVRFEVNLKNTYIDKDLKNIELIDTYPNELLELDGNSIPDNCSADATQIRCFIESLPTEKNATEEYPNLFSFEPIFTALKNGDTTNMAVNQVVARDDSGHENMAEASALIKTPDNPLYLTKSLTKTTTIEVGQEIEYTVSLKNRNKHQDMENLILRDTYPRDLLELIPESLEEKNCIFGAGLIECEVGILKAAGTEETPAEESIFTISPRFVAIEKTDGVPSNNATPQEDITYTCGGEEQLTCPTGYSCEREIEEENANGTCRNDTPKNTENKEEIERDIYIATNTAQANDGAGGHADIFSIDLIVTPPVVRDLELTSDCEGENVLITSECRFQAKALYEYADPKIVSEDSVFYNYENIGEMESNIFTATTAGESQVTAVYNDVTSNEMTITVIDTLGVATSPDGEMITHFPARTTLSNTDAPSDTIHYGGKIMLGAEEGGIGVTAKHNRLIFDGFGGTGNYSWFLEDTRYGTLYDFEEVTYGNPYDNCWEEAGKTLCEDPELGTIELLPSCRELEDGMICQGSDKVIFETKNLEGEVVIELFDDEDHVQALTIHILPPATKSIEIKDVNGNSIDSMIELPQADVLQFTAGEELMDSSILFDQSNELNWEMRYNGEEFTSGVEGLGNILGGLLEPTATGTFSIRAKKEQTIALPGTDALRYDTEEVHSDEIVVLIGDAVPYIDSLRTAGNLGMAKGTTETLYVRLRHFGGLAEVGDIELNLLRGAYNHPNEIPEDVQHFTIDLLDDQIMRELVGKNTVLLEIPFFVPILDDIKDGLHTFRLTVNNMNGEDEDDIVTGLLSVYVGDPEMGDVTLDGDIDLADAVLSMRFIEETQEPNAIQERTLDSDGKDGITMRDFLEVFRTFLLNFLK